MRLHKNPKLMRVLKNQKHAQAKKLVGEMRRFQKRSGVDRFDYRGVFSRRKHFFSSKNIELVLSLADAVVKKFDSLPVRERRALVASEASQGWVGTHPAVKIREFQRTIANAKRIRGDLFTFSLYLRFLKGQIGERQVVSALKKRGLITIEKIDDERVKLHFSRKGQTLTRELDVKVAQKSGIKTLRTSFAKVLSYLAGHFDPNYKGYWKEPPITKAY